LLTQQIAVLGQPAVGCLTEPGIVCFLAVFRAKLASCPNLKAGKQHEASEGVPAALTSPQKVVIPAKAGIHIFTNYLKRMDSRLRGNDTQVLSRLFAVVSDLARITQAGSPHATPIGYPPLPETHP
jgi:hypothetical protein